MKGKKNGFTLIELLAVIVILGLLLTIATIGVLKYIKDSKAKAKYSAAKEIMEMASAYMESESEYVFEEPADSGNKCIRVIRLIDTGYLESDATNPANGKNGFPKGNNDFSKVCEAVSDAQTDYEPTINGENAYYSFDGYKYMFKSADIE